MCNGFGGGCSWIIIIILILLCCGGCGCGNDCGCNNLVLLRQRRLGRLQQRLRRLWLLIGRSHNIKASRLSESSRLAVL